MKINPRITLVVNNPGPSPEFIARTRKLGDTGETWPFKPTKKAEGDLVL